MIYIYHLGLGFHRALSLWSYCLSLKIYVQCEIFTKKMEDSRLKKLRLERGYTQIKMQMLTGIDQSDYSKIELGRRYYTFEQCKLIAIVLNTSMDYLAGLTDIEDAYPRKSWG